MPCRHRACLQMSRAVIELFGGDPVRALAEMPVEMRQLVRGELIDPALVTGMLLSAHLIIFWLSQDSNVTPPVCLVAFTAAAIAGTKPMRTGLTSWKVAKRPVPGAGAVCLYTIDNRQLGRAVWSCSVLPASDFMRLPASCNGTLKRS